MVTSWPLSHDRSGSTSVQMLVLTCALALGSVAGVRALRGALDARADCAGEQIESLAIGVRCAQSGLGAPASLAVPVPPPPPRRTDRDRVSDRESGGGPDFFGPLDDFTETVVALPGNVVDRGREVAGGIGERVDDVADGIRDRGGDAVGGLVDLAEDAHDLVVHLPHLVDGLREGIGDGLLEPLHLADKLGRLDPGDSLTLAAGGEFSGGLAGAAEVSIEVTRTEDGFVVTASATGLVGGGLKIVDILGGPTGSAEFTFAKLDEARQGIEGLLKIPTLPTPAGLAVGPSADELDTLVDHVSAIEVDASAVGQLDFLIGLTDFRGGGAEGELAVSRSARIELEDGRPSAIVSVAEVSGEGAVEVTDRLAHDLGFDSSGVHARVEAEGRVALEVRRPIRRSPPGDDAPAQLAGILLHPDQVELGPATAGVSADLGFELNDRGAELGLEIEGLEREDILPFLDRVRDGDLEGAVAGTGQPISGSFNTFDESGVDRDVDVVVVSAGVENTIHDVSNAHEVDVRPDPTGTELGVFIDGRRVSLSDVLGAAGLGR